MTARGFRRIALGMTGAIESAHMGHPDFRVNGRIFATLGYPDSKWGMVALTPEQQQTSISECDAMMPAKGAWGLQGATMVRLAGIDEETLGLALTPGRMRWPSRRREHARAGRAGDRANPPIRRRILRAVVVDGPPGRRLVWGGV